MQFRILGPVEVDIDGALLPLPRRRERCLLGVLLLEPGQVVSVDRLAELLWDGRSPKRVRGAVQGYVSRLRTLLESTRAKVEFASNGYRIVVEPDQVDVHRFRALVHRAAESSDPAEQIEWLRAALDLWRGPVLADAIDGWARERLCFDLEQRRITAVEDLATASLRLRRERQILPELARIAGENLSREGLVALHMRALYQSGRKADAVDAFARARTYLADELGLDPSPALQDLYRSILRDELAVPPSAEAASTNPPKPVVSALQVVPRQLPADTPGFVGRAEYLDRLDRLLAGTSDSDTPVVISTIDGTAGVGKTALAVHWAHRVANQFPDGQLYVNLRGFDPAFSPMDPAEAVRILLDAFEVPLQRIPASLDAQVGLYRSLLSGRRVLVVLDNARDAEQVRPLLPGASGCFAIVTSRNRLSSLVVVESAVPMTLEVLATAEAQQLLANRLGAHNVPAQRDEVIEIIRWCVRLPLALAVVAARAADRPDTAFRQLAEELHHGNSSLEVLAGSDPSVDMRVVFSWSYRLLTNDAARLFRLLGLHPGPDIGIQAAASLAGVRIARVRQLLGELLRANLVAEQLPARYASHDLLRAYAAELVDKYDGEHDRHNASRRVLDYYVLTAHRAALTVRPERTPLDLAAPAQGVCYQPPSSVDDALSWLTSERACLVAAVAYAATAGFDAHAWQIAWALVSFLDSRGYWHDQLGTQSAALAAARRRGDVAAQAQINRYLGQAYARLGQWHEAEVHLRAALDGYAEQGNYIGQATALHGLAMACEREGRVDEALNHTSEMLRLSRLGKYRPGEASGLQNLGWVHARMGDYEQAISYGRQAIRVWQEIEGRDPSGECEGWSVLGYAYSHLAQHQEAIACHRRAVALFDGVSDRYGQAMSLDRLGDAYQWAGNNGAACVEWRRAVAILEQLEHPAADRVRSKLAS